jgi:hypothetical protein
MPLGFPQTAERPAERARQPFDMVGAPVGKAVVSLVPDALVGIQFRRIGGEALQVQPPVAATEGPDGFAVVDAAVVLHHNHVPGQMTQQVAEESAHIGLLDVLRNRTARPPSAAAGAW